MLAAVSGLYALFMVLWFGLYRHGRDAIWWMALLNAFAPLFFVPAVGLLLLGIVTPSSAASIGAIPAALIFFHLYGHLFRAKAPPQRETAGDPVRLMTFNIWFHSWSEKTVQVLEQNGEVDVVALQELTRPMAKRLLDAYGDRYPHHLLQVGTGTPRLGMFSRYPLIPVATEQLAAFDFRIQAAQVLAPTGAFLLYNVHPRATNLISMVCKRQSVAREATRSLHQRLRGIERLLTEVASQGQPVVVVGDFNSTPQSEVYARLSAQLVDVHRTAGWGFGHTFPVHGKDIGGFPRLLPFMRLDMIFHTPQLVALHSRVGKYHGDSDHLPVITALARRPEAV
jgi:endonuclease/exonuclease/phosphatase (EEP) superfamily protein YafD